MATLIDQDDFSSVQGMSGRQEFADASGKPVKNRHCRLFSVKNRVRDCDTIVGCDFSDRASIRQSYGEGAPDRERRFLAAP